MQREHEDIMEVVRKGFDVTLQKVDKLENQLKGNRQVQDIHNYYHCRVRVRVRT